MTRKKTNEEFIRDARKMHGLMYGYDNCVYNGATNKVAITCSLHGDWHTKPGDHINGSGCPECAKIKVANARRKSEIKVRQEILNVHGNRYSYREILGYVNKDSKIDICCNEHGWFSQTVHNHVFNKTGCPACALKDQSERCRKPMEKFIADANNVHNFKYSYERVIYSNSEMKVEILCADHGSFWQAPGSHLSGRGCPYCAIAGFKGSQEGFLYVLTDGDMTKVGITNNDPNKRCKTVARYSGKDLKVLKFYHFDEGWKARKIETMILDELRQRYMQPLSPFDGWRECFYDVNMASLLNKIESLIKEQNSSNNQAAQAA